MISNTRRIVGAIVCVAAATALVASCSSSSDDDASASSTTEKAPATTDRPEGEWNTVRWLTARVGVTQLGESTVSVSKFTPTCKSGPCDIEVTPAGTQGTYRPEGYPLTDPVEPGQPVTYTWDEATESYFNVAKTTEDCTTTTGEVPDGYEATRTTRLQFHPADGDAPESLHGTMEEAVTGTPEGAAKGCTDYSATWAVAGAPVGAFDGADGAKLADSFVVTEVVEATEPAGGRPKGFRGVLVPDATATVDGDTAQLTGTLDTPAALQFADGRWSGSATSSTQRCSEGEGPGELDTTENWTDLRTVAVTEDGAPVLVGGWQQTAVPNAAGTAAGCTAASNKGFVILVPKAAVDGSGGGSTGATTTAPGGPDGSGGSTTTAPGGPDGSGGSTTTTAHGAGH